LTRAQHQCDNRYPITRNTFLAPSNYRQHSSVLVLVAEAQSRLGLLRGQKLHGHLTIFWDIFHAGGDAKCSSRRSPAARDFPERRVQSGKLMRDSIVEHEHERIVVGYVGGGRATSLDSAHWAGAAAQPTSPTQGLRLWRLWRLLRFVPRAHRSTSQMDDLTQRWSSTTRAALLLLSPFCGSLQPPALKR
jgi:hypothetical protein